MVIVGLFGSLQRKRGMTLVEVVIAVALAATVSIGMYGSAIYTMRQTARNIEQVQALMIVNGTAAKLRAARYNKLAANPASLGNNDFEKQFNSTQSIKSDTLANAPSTTYTLKVGKKGYGKGINPTALGSCELTLGTGGEKWTANEFQGRLLVVTGGTAANCVMYIISHNATGTNGKTVAAVTSYLEYDPTKPAKQKIEPWAVTPDTTSVYAVDYGMYCDTTVTWDNGEKSLKETVYVPTSQN